MPKVREGAKYEKKYTEENISSALKAIENGMSERKASKTFSVPRQTLQFRKSDKFNHKTSLGPNTVLSSEEEDTLVDWILTSYKKGFPVRKTDIQFSVKEFLDANPRDNPFHDNLPGDGWYKAFLKRHSVLTHRTPEAVTAASSVVSEADIRKWFSSVEEYLKSKGLEDILQDPRRIFNGDETCFYLCPKNVKVIAPRGARNVYEVDSSQAKMNITVMFTFSAAGDVTDPMIIYPYKRLPAAIINSIPVKSWGVGHSDNGWMKVELFYEYIGNVLYPSLKKRNTTFPIILFVDGHSTHQTLKLSQLCTELGIILVALYPNSTRIMQPADVAAFKPMKTGWKKAVLEFRRKNPHETLTKEKFASVLETVIADYAKAETIKHGFQATGLFPWNASSIDYTKCLGIKRANDLEKNQNLDSETPPNSCISYNQFKNIVGHDRIDIFKRIQTFDEDNNDEFILLYKLYREFNKNHHSPERENRKAEALDNEPQKVDENQKLLNIENLDIIFEDNLSTGQEGYIREDNTLEKLNSKESLQSVNQSVNDIEIFEVLDDNEHQYTTHDQRESFMSGEAYKMEEEKAKEVIKMQEYKSSEVHNNPQSSVNKNKIKILDYVVWPKTPERKGKKNTERLPFVLTSTHWKKIQMEKLDAKKQEQEMKEARKVKRSLKINASQMKKENKKGGRRKNDTTEIVGEGTSALYCKKPKINQELHDPSDSVLNLPGPSNLHNFVHVVRNVFNDEDNEATNEIEFPKNLSANGKLCFICTKTINPSMKGVKCFTCLRTYHNKCIKKMDSNVDNFDIFRCKSCFEKK